jgi:hypothetical protein
LTLAAPAPAPASAPVPAVGATTTPIPAVPIAPIAPVASIARPEPLQLEPVADTIPIPALGSTPASTPPALASTGTPIQRESVRSASPPPAFSADASSLRQPISLPSTTIGSDVNMSPLAERTSASELEADVTMTARAPKEHAARVVYGLGAIVGNMPLMCTAVESELLDVLTPLGVRDMPCLTLCDNRTPPSGLHALKALRRALAERQAQKLL